MRASSSAPASRHSAAARCPTPAPAARRRAWRGWTELARRHGARFRPDAGWARAECVNCAVSRAQNGLCYHRLHRDGVNYDERNRGLALMSEERPVDVALLRKILAIRRHEEGQSGRPGAQGVGHAGCRPIACCSRKATRTSAPIWLVSGMLELREGDRTVAMIRAGSPEARNPMAPSPAAQGHAPAPWIRSSTSPSTANCWT